MRKIDRIRNIVERKGRTVLGDSFETGYYAGVENVKKEILEIINEEIKLVDFVETEQGRDRQGKTFIDLKDRYI